MSNNRWWEKEGNAGDRRNGMYDDIHLYELSEDGEESLADILREELFNKMPVEGIENVVGDKLDNLSVEQLKRMAEKCEIDWKFEEHLLKEQEIEEAWENTDDLYFYYY